MRFPILLSSTDRQTAILDSNTVRVTFTFLALTRYPILIVSKNIIVTG